MCLSFASLASLGGTMSKPNLDVITGRVYDSRLRAPSELRNFLPCFVRWAEERVSPPTTPKPNVRVSCRVVSSRLAAGEEAMLGSRIACGGRDVDIRNLLSPRPCLPSIDKRDRSWERKGALLHVAIYTSSRVW